MSLNTSPANRIWVPEINLIRGFAILSVILIHVTAYFGAASVLSPVIFVNMFADGFLHYAVPLFILISGLVLSLAYWRGENYVVFYRKRLQSIIPQYVIFSALYIAFSAFFLGWTVNISTVLNEMLTGTAWIHFWFIPLILELYLLYPVLVIIYDYFEKNNRAKSLLIIALVIQFSFSVGQVLTDTVVVGADAASQLIFNSFIAYIFYFFAGIYVGRNIDTVKKKIKTIRLFPLVLLAIFGSSIATLYYSTRYFATPAGLSMNIAYLGWSLAIPLVTLAMFVIFFRLASWPGFHASRTGYFVGEIGTYAFGIYLIHALFITGYELVLTHILGIGVQTILFYVLLAALTIVSSYVFVKIVVRLPVGDWIIGVKTRKPLAQNSNESTDLKL